MAFVNVRVVAGVIDRSERKRLLEGITDLVTEGDEQIQGRLT